MFDYHYDLLTNVYINRSNPQKLKEDYKKIYNRSNITGGIFNLFFMSKEEMKDELNISEDEINLKKMLATTHKIIKEYKIIPDGIKYVYGIEGLDYLEDLDDIEELYSFGVRSVNIVWNNENKFGGGSKANTNVGLTRIRKEVNRKVSKIQYNYRLISR